MGANYKSATMNLVTNMNQVAEELASLKNMIELVWKDMGAGP